MNRRWTVFLLFGILLLCGCGKDDKDRIISGNPQHNCFYYDQLTPEEVEVLNQVTEICNSYHGDLIVLENAISLNSLVKIQITLRHDDSYGLWYFINCYPEDDEGRLIINTPNANKRIVRKIFVQVYDTDKRNDEMEAFLSDITESGGTINEERFLDFLSHNHFDEEIYNKINSRIEEEVNNIVESLSIQSDVDEIIDAVGQWFINNMEYDSEFSDSFMSMNKQASPLQVQEYVTRSNLLCVIDKKALCGGLSTLFTRISNRIGLKSYVVTGYIFDQSGKEETHGWNAIIVGDRKYYYDPTVVVMIKKPQKIRLRVNIEKQGSSSGYVFNTLFNY